MNKLVPKSTLVREQRNVVSGQVKHTTCRPLALSGQGIYSRNSLHSFTRRPPEYHKGTTSIPLWYLPGTEQVPRWYHFSVIRGSSEYQGEGDPWGLRGPEPVQVHGEQRPRLERDPRVEQLNHCLHFACLFLAIAQPALRWKGRAESQF